jgi:2,4-dienoyl-CoA reductase-like NADH-dependent reductase (Old Yellow Enzyme family)
MGPLTNMQSLPNGRMSEEEYRWLEMRTRGGFGMMSTCAANVQANSAQLSGQLGIYEEDHLDPLRRIAAEMKAHGNIALTQLNHGGLRSNPEVTGVSPVGPYDDPEWGGRAMTTAEIHELIEDFVRAARRAEAVGFDGVEIHGAHGQIMAQFLDPVRNQRTDGYGGSLENRARLITEVLSAIRERCRPDFLLGLRLSVERFEINLSEFRTLSEFYMVNGLVDFMDMSLWDCFKEPDEAQYRGRPLIECALDVKRGAARIGVAGKIRTAEKASACIAAGADFVIIGRAAILHEDFPRQVAGDPRFAMRALPVPESYLRARGRRLRARRLYRRWRHGDRRRADLLCHSRRPLPRVTQRLNPLAPFPARDH